MRKIVLTASLSLVLLLSACSQKEQFILPVPETSTKVLLHEGDMAHYKDGLERGVVVGDFSKLQKFDNKMILPFVVSNQGSGVFYYIALFKDKKFVQSFFIGDRVKIKSIKQKEDTLVVHYITRDKQEKIKQFKL